MECPQSGKSRNFVAYMSNSTKKKFISEEYTVVDRSFFNSNGVFVFMNKVSNYSSIN